MSQLLTKAGIVQSHIEIKGAGPDDGLPDGTFVGYASVFGNVDSYGDIVEPGAFTDTLETWRAKGDPIPLLWGHDMYDPFSNLGHINADDAVEDDKGLLVKGTFDLDNPTALQVYRMVKGRRVTDMSFAYGVEGEYKSPLGNHLTKLSLVECSIVPIGANNETDIVGVKARLNVLSVKAGRALSSANEGVLRDAITKLSEAMGTIDSVLATVAIDGDEKLAGKADAGPVVPADVEASADDDGKEAPPEEPSAETRPVKGDKVTEDRKHVASVETLAAHLHLYALAGAELS